ncbi:MAG: wbbL 1 [Rubritepida sp.]|nr:wbbL 1 [Rubritepida sp.]
MPYDFIDIGCSKGGSLAWGAANFGGTGLGIDLDERKVQATLAAGHHAIVADARHLDLPDNAVRFATLSDVLEHMPDGEIAEKCLAEAYRVASEFVLVRGPNFDRGDYLAKNALKKYFADWRGHTWHHQTEDFVRLAQRVGAREVLLLSHERIHSSEHPDILPASAPQDQGRYDPAAHGPKPFITFGRKIYSRIVMVLGKVPEANLQRIALTACSGRVVNFMPATGGPAEVSGYSSPRSKGPHEA